MVYAVPALDIPLRLNLHAVQLSDEQFYRLCVNNPELQLERDRQGRLIIMAPMGGESGNWELELGTDVALWNRQSKQGRVFSSSTLFKLPIGSDRSPDVAWVERSRWDSLTPEQRQKFVPLAPDFALELRSPSDSLQTLQDKMQEYLDSGVRLAWLLNPQDQTVEIYRPGQDPEVRSLPTVLSGEGVMVGFELTIDRFPL
ncbi:MAG: Uma2 family endonuclease [Prochlorothrix sp.]|nr:Uma2 family endonuclease [Prochlorothrix sp.]